MGAGKSWEMLRFYEAENAMVLFRFLQSYPAVKSKNVGVGIKLVEPVSRDEYLRGKTKEKIDPLAKRDSVRFNIVELCTLEPVTPENPCPEPMVASTADYSVNSIAVKCAGNNIAIGSVFHLTVESIGIIKKKVEVM
ncbi:MAG: hypothetical protein IME96_09560 [Proteobacteria bacterium]|nr:hypothetical protein [Pseudomonadota bacterium]